MFIDERFLKPNEHTVLWWSQRATCRKCLHYIPPSEENKDGGEKCGTTPRKSGGKFVYEFCIDARTEGMPCGPEAKLFSDIETVRSAESVQLSNGYLSVVRWFRKRSKTKEESWARKFLSHFLKAQVTQDQKWVKENPPVFCDYLGERWRVIGMSVLGECLLSREPSGTGEVDIKAYPEDCSSWGFN